METITVTCDHLHSYRLEVSCLSGGNESVGLLILVIMHLYRISSRTQGVFFFADDCILIHS